jgi:hypothetical protein
MPWILNYHTPQRVRTARQAYAWMSRARHHGRVAKTSIVKKLYFNNGMYGYGWYRSEWLVLTTFVGETLPNAGRFLPNLFRTRVNSPSGQTLDTWTTTWREAKAEHQRVVRAHSPKRRKKTTKIVKTQEKRIREVLTIAPPPIRDLSKLRRAIQASGGIK